MQADPHAFRVKFRKMAADPFAFYRGSACLFYADMTTAADDWADDRTSRVWIHGDLHAENFGTYMNSHGRMVFDVNDFDEAYIGHFSWDLRRFVASLALMGWQKALPEETVRNLIGRYLRAYLAQVTPLRHHRRRTTTSRCTWRTPTARCTTCSPRRGLASRVALLDGDDPVRGRACGCSPRTRRSGGSARPSAQGGEGVRGTTSRRSPSPRSSTATCSTTCATSSASPASASAAPGCRRTTCWSRATASRSTTTWCCR